ncbi:hypothetical protein NX722_23925 [Endozoicomonas gorgoniicola]|uniref:Putative adhesin Stv domain-containing protein n=1 Tax=Endozoicomonas gorgoniicola TaxID=1234144 RepID=A0ABT3N1V0_9GAMM|nr:hypothetical protein [Endozoicomonas gorgoniicola]MCW7555617.1 hypothetical protein [Endozoicomonas gorgoniicola]
MIFFRPTVKKTILMNALNLYSCKGYSGNTVQSLIIDCHGLFIPRKVGVLDSEDFFTLPAGMSLYYYAPHGTALFSSLVGLMAGEYEPLEIFTSGQLCANYALQPTSMSLVRGSLTIAEAVKKMISDDRINTGKKAIAHPLWEFDIVQPRFEMYLNRVIRILQQTNQPYTRIHSNFCRESVHALIRRKYDPSVEESPHTYQGDLGRWHIL